MEMFIWKDGAKNNIKPIHYSVLTDLGLAGQTVIFTNH